MSEKLYYEVVETEVGYAWKVYHYDPTGNREIVVARSSQRTFYTEGQAADDCCEWQEANGIDAELS
jgi:hypothetical protein